MRTDGFEVGTQNRKRVGFELKMYLKWSYKICAIDAEILRRLITRTKSLINPPSA